VSELDFLKQHAPEPSKPSADTWTSSKRALLAHIASHSGAGRRLKLRSVHRPLGARWALVSAVVGTVVLLAVAFVLTNQLGGEKTAAAAVILREAAQTAAKQPEPVSLAAGQYLYVRSDEAYLDYFSGPGGGCAALVPTTREVWLGEKSHLVQTEGEPRFLTQRDRDRWVADGSPDIGRTSTDISLGIITPVELSTDPDMLFERLKQEADDAGHGLYLEMFVLVGDNLRETLASSELRAALYEVAARVPGVDLDGTMRDSTGREGIGVSMADKTDHTRHTLIIDPETSRLLEERDVVLDDRFELGYPAGTVIGYATYLVSTPVRSNFDRPGSVN
jgi:hypothetical protein